MAKATFIRFIGNAWLYGKDVAAYKVEGGVRLTAETTGGKVIAPPKTVSEEEFNSLLVSWTQAGVLHRGDARITEAALSYMGAR